eukprot:scaffold43011_cov16-Prasinocladus_malaysianus.AAC.1
MVRDQAGAVQDLSQHLQVGGGLLTGTARSSSTRFTFMPIVLHGDASNYISLMGDAIRVLLLLQLSIHSNVSTYNAQSGPQTAPTELWAKMPQIIAWTVLSHKYFGRKASANLV